MVIAPNSSDYDLRTPPIFCLPTELIVKIFKRVQSSSNGYAHPDDTLHTSALDNIFPDNTSIVARDCLHVTEVCRRWRDAAFQCRELWQIVDISSGERWRKLCTERAQGLSLILHTGVPRRTPDSTYKRRVALRKLAANMESRNEGYPLRGEREHFLSKHLPHAVEATLAELDDVSFPHVFTDMTCDSLRYLKLDSCVFVIDASFLGGSLPLLTTLDLEVDDVEAWPHFPNLRHLKLHIWAPSPRTGRTLIDISEQTKKLEVLNLTCYATDMIRIPHEYHSDSDSPHDQGLVPALRVMKLVLNDVVTCWELLRAFSPPSIGLVISLHSVHFQSQELARPSHRLVYIQVIGHLMQYWASHVQPPLLGHVIISESSRTFTLTSPGEPHDQGVLNQPFCTLEGPYLAFPFPAHSLVKTLTLQGDCSAPEFVAPEQNTTYGMKSMECLDTVILVRAGRVDYINGVENWLIKRKNLGRRIRRLIISCPETSNAIRALQRMSDRLLEEQTVDDVNLDGLLV